MRTIPRWATKSSLGAWWDTLLNDLASSPNLRLLRNTFDNRYEALTSILRTSSSGALAAIARVRRMFTGLLHPKCDIPWSAWSSGPGDADQREARLRESAGDASRPVAGPSARGCACNRRWRVGSWPTGRTTTGLHVRPRAPRGLGQRPRSSRRWLPRSSSAFPRATTGSTS